MTYTKEQIANFKKAYPELFSNQPIRSWDADKKGDFKIKKAIANLIMNQERKAQSPQQVKLSNYLHLILN
jgi:predicted esterase